MAKQKSVFVCSSCGYECARWLGKCPSCQEWNTLQEELVQPEETKSKAPMLYKNTAATRLAEVSIQDFVRFPTGIGELDRVLGGGVVPASVILCGGDPGIGKSTLLLQAADFVAKTRKVLYISAEESAQQVKLRAARLGCSMDQLFILAETDLDEICHHIQQLAPDMVVVDSIQTVYLSALSSAPGSVSQVRECASRLMRLAKEQGCAIFLIGHVTKEGSLAGPKVLEHIVDTVLYFEGERNNIYRLLRAIKNRFGSTNEIGIFEMRETGMMQVLNPSELLLSQRSEAVSGTAVLCSMEGSRPVLAEVQALISTSGFGNPRRMSSGTDYNRLVMLLAVLEKRLGYGLYNQDVYVNIAGGLHIDEPAMDLALLAAVASSYRNIPVPADTVLMGEVGLTGELRAIGHCQRRVDECAKLGFSKIILPKANRKTVKASGQLKLEFSDNLYHALCLALGDQE